MIYSIALTAVIFLCAYMVIAYAMPPIADQILSWLLRAAVILVAIVAVVHVWGLV